MPVNRRNWAASKLMQPDNQSRFDPALGFAEADTLFQSLTSLVGFWPGSCRGSSSSSGTELSDKGPRLLHLAVNGAPALTVNPDMLAVYHQYDGSADWFSHATAASFDITGHLTIASWVKFDTSGGSDEVVAAKWGASGNRSYRLYRNAAGNGVFEVSSNGTAVTSVTTGSALIAGRWYFLAGRLSLASQLRIWYGSISDLNSNENMTSIPASIFNSTADFTIGAQSGGSNHMDGAIGRVALCATNVTDVAIAATFHRTRAIYGAI